jgi:hypothetical protein
MPTKTKKKIVVDFKERDNFMLEKTNLLYEKEEKVRANDYDIFGFEGLEFQDAKTCVQKGWLDLNEAQNDSPTVGKIIEFLRSNPSFSAIGYVVNSERKDTRISFEGVIAIKEPTPKEYKAYVDMFRTADEFDNEMPFRAWYD